MDPIENINYKKDSTLALLWEAEIRNYEIYYFEQSNLYLENNRAYGVARKMSLHHDESNWFTFHESLPIALKDLSVMLMRKDPPVNDTFLYTTYLLESAVREGTLVVNQPQSLRDANEKLFATLFPECMPQTLVTQSIEKLKEFWLTHETIVCKSLNSMGGASVFYLQKNDVNANVIFAMLTQNETQFLMAQKFIPEIVHGDKRILMINGTPVPHALARIPAKNDWRGNLAAGARAEIQPLSKRDYEICEQVGPVLKQRGLMFVGLDVIGDYLSEINVTSPTGIREIDHGANMNVSALLFDAIEEKIK